MKIQVIVHTTSPEVWVRVAYQAGDDLMDAARLRSTCRWELDGFPNLLGHHWAEPDDVEAPFTFEEHWIFGAKEAVWV